VSNPAIFRYDTTAATSETYSCKHKMPLLLQKMLSKSKKIFWLIFCKQRTFKHCRRSPNSELPKQNRCL